jgi:hypothetical protein
MDNSDSECIDNTTQRAPWNKGKLVGAKPPLRPKHVWAIRLLAILSVTTFGYRPHFVKASSGILEVRSDE